MYKSNLANYKQSCYNIFISLKEGLFHLDWTKLFTMQKELDAYIEKNNQVEDQDLFQKKILALIVELGELANETRSFKFWSKNTQVNEQAILEEYVDGIHFILSLGLEKDYNYKGETVSLKKKTINEQFLLLYELIVQFKEAPTGKNYESLFSSYLQLGSLLNISSEELKTAYIKKNEVNFKRQDEGY